MNLKCMLGVILAGGLAFAGAAVESEACVRQVKILPGEAWWGGANDFGGKMPFGEASEVKIDLTRDNYSNQFSSFLVSNKGRYLWCDAQTVIDVKGGEIAMRNDVKAPIELVETGGTLRDAYLAAAKKHFPPSGKSPHPLFFSAPQYNTWIELTYFQNQEKILAYAKSMLANGLPPGVFMIDDTWQAGYGTWEFDARNFTDPKKMCDELHALGFKVILWICPWVSMDSPAYRRVTYGVNPGSVVREKDVGGFYLGEDGSPYASKWWNGKSALLDFTHPNANLWFKAQLDRLVRDYGVDGFKFDGGELVFYGRGAQPHDKAVSSADQTYLYGKYALEYPVTEYRNAWKLQGQPVVVRLIDKPHSWQAVRALVTDMLAGGLLGYPFVCPDMVGGGSWTAFLPGSPFDPELFVRSAQVHALCGQMQFSASPWRTLDEENQAIVRETVKTRQRFAPFFEELARECGRTGEPMLRHLAYVFPGCGYEKANDQFLMGKRLLVAPVLEKGAVSRKVVIPPGRWRGDDGQVVEGPREIKVKAPLSRLPHFVRDEASALDNRQARLDAL